MYNIVALMGESGSGKDTVLKETLIQFPDLHKIITSTSRPKREKEEDGVNYFYYTDEEFIQKIQNYEMLDWQIFNNWQYGTELKALDENKINIGVFSPRAIRTLLKRKDCNVLAVWVRTTDKERLLRQLNREENPNVREIVRRATTDYEDFDNIEFDYYEVLNEVNIALLAIPTLIMGQIETRFGLGQESSID